MQGLSNTLEASCSGNATCYEEWYNNNCSALNDGSHFIQLTNQADSSLWLQLLGLVAAIINVWFAFLIYRHKEL